jgi:hypothetical protein
VSAGRVARLYTFGFLFVGGRLNLPVISTAVGFAAMASLAVAHGSLAADRARVAARMIAVGFAAFALAMAALAWLVEQAFSPHGQIMSRYNPVLAGMMLGLAAIVMSWRGKPLLAWIGAPALAIIVALAPAQAAADIAATARWRAYIHDFQARLAHSAGLVAWPTISSTGDAAQDQEWRLMTAQWVVPLMSIIFARGGRVAAIFEDRKSVV